MKNTIYIILFTFLATSCSNTKYLPEGELLYVGGKVIVKNDSISKKERKSLESNLQDLIRPIPNQKILGLRPKLTIHNWAGKVTKEKGFWFWLKYKVGEPPVLFSKVDLNYNKSVLQNYVENNGYFNATSKADSTLIGKKVKAEYVVNPNKQYKIKSIKFPNDSSKIAIEIFKLQNKSFLKIGEAYSLDKIKAERNRIDATLKEKGFFFFNADYLKVQVDSTVGRKEVDLIVKIKSETPEKSKNPYQINKIKVYPNYVLNQDSILKDGKKHNDFVIYDSEKTFNPRIFDRTLYFKKGDLYNRTNHNLSLNRLVSLGTFKFVKNQFAISDSLKNCLDVTYFLTPFTRKSIRVELLAKTNSANYTGTELNVNWSNRNTFRGAELLTITAFGGYEVQVAGENNGFNVYRFGSEANLLWPRIIAPFKFTSSSGFVPKTKATLGYEYQNRTQLYALQTFKASFGYLWKENERKDHELNITEITFASPQNVSDLYNSKILANPALGKVIEKQLIFGPTYSYIYTNMMQKNKKHTIYNKFTADFSANITGLIAGSNLKQGDTTKVFGVPFSQFMKFENEFKHYLKLTEKSLIASRFIAGVGFAYGNSNEMPFIKQFFNGGTNSLRAFRARSIGPGSFKESTTNVFLPDQSGDVKLEFSTEYRANIYRFLNAAIFIDAGNIWLLNDNINKPNSKFSKDFLNEIAVGTGVGLRFVFSFLVLRTDLAFPIRKPYLFDGNRWVIDKISFGNNAWRNENLVFNLAIGYPF
jgi:outer membrane protein insertion porin family